MARCEPVPPVCSHHATYQALNRRTIRGRIRAAQSETTVEKSGLQVIPQSAVTTMSPQDSQHLHALLRNFGAERLGEGDVTAGANVLAAMAVSLANVQRPGSGLATWEGNTIAAGASLLVSGAHSCSLISDRVLRGVATRQNNLTARFGQRRTREIDKGGGSAGMPQTVSSDLAASWAETVMQQLGEPGAITDQQATEFWGALVRITPPTDITYLQHHPTVFVTGTKAAEMAGQLERCHLGRPVLHVGIDSVADFARFEHLCPAVMDGRATVGPLAETVRGTVMVTDPNAMLGEVVRDDLPSARWTSRMVWLVDDNFGPDPGDAEDDGRPVPLGGIERRFETAMGLAWGRRISDRECGPVLLEFDFSEAQTRWIRFLKKLEPEFPGICGTARCLFVSLLFGLRQLVDAAAAPAGFRMPVEQVEAFARFLAHRLVNARAVALELAEATRRERLEMSIINKLADGPLGLRDLTRRFYRLPSVTCHELLLDLEATGKVAQSKGRWHLARSGLLTIARDRDLVLEA